eukprot:gene24801-10446_t
MGIKTKLLLAAAVSLLVKHRETNGQVLKHIYKCPGVKHLRKLLIAILSFGDEDSNQAGALVKPGTSYASKLSAGTAQQLIKPAKSSRRNLAAVVWFPEPDGKIALAATSLHKAVTRRTLDICVFTITCDEISDAVMDLHKLGVKVRVITDDDQSGSLGSDIQKFRDIGIPVKFAILDNSVLLNGRTRSAVLGNQENIVIMDHPDLVKTPRDPLCKLHCTIASAALTVDLEDEASSSATWSTSTASSSPATN